VELVANALTNAASGKILYLTAKGQTSVDPETAIPLTTDTTFWMASCTKLLTTVAALQCVERGELSLDEDVSAILPELRAPDVLTGFDEAGQPRLTKATKKITLRLLLTHSSGMGYDFLSPDLKRWREQRGEPTGPKGNITKDYTMPLLYEPGDGWAYGCSIDWAGKMVERVNGGMRLGDYMKEHVWGPLGMTSTGFRLAENDVIRTRLCATTAKNPTGDFVPAAPYPNQNPPDDLGGGGLYSSVPDYIQVLVSLLRNDGKLLKPDTVKLMFTAQLPDNKHMNAMVTDPAIGPMFRSGVDSQAWNWGLGGALNTEDVDGVCKKGTMTWSGLPNLFWWIDPSLGICGLYASQLLPPGDSESIALAVDFRKHVFQVATGSS